MASDAPQKGSRAQKWEDNYNQVLKIAQATGKLHLPRKKAETRRLGNWLSRQKHRKDMSLPERAKLEELKKYGYDVFRDGNDAWDYFFNQLLEYKRTVGRLRIDQTDPQWKKLSKWASLQRQKNKEGTLSDERKKRLSDIGFAFKANRSYKKKARFTKAQEQQWDGMYAQLCRFKEETGHCNVPVVYEPNQALANWVSMQRILFSQGTIDTARAERLDSIDFSWRLARGGKNKIVAETQLAGK